MQKDNIPFWNAFEVDTETAFKSWGIDIDDLKRRYRELEKLNGTYIESMDMYKIIKDSTDKARSIARFIEQQIIRNNEELLSSNPHTSIYKILDAIDEFNNLND